MIGGLCPDSRSDSPEATERFIAALAHRRRRYVLHRLLTNETSMAMAELADDIVAWEGETTRTETATEEVARARASLYHAHIPKLEEVGLVEYDAESNTVHYRGPDGMEDAFALTDGARNEPSAGRE